ncbi:MAG: thiamine diphosphokinase, partial [Fidelibacterota bacterium]
AFPTHPVPLAALREAGTLICTDGSRDRARQAGLSPTLTVGDMDSLKDRSTGPGEWIRPETGQETTDLEKALEWCLENGIARVTLTGITGGRDDHTLGNLYVLANSALRLEVTGLTDHFTISCVWDEQTFTVHPGRRVSLLPVIDSPVVSTEGLQYPLSHESLLPGGRGISNRATGDSFFVSVSDGGLLVFIQHPE